MRMTHLNGLTTLMLLAVGPFFAACQAQPLDALGNNAGALGGCKPRDEIPPPVAGAPNGGACPAVGSDCQNIQPPINFCTDGHRRMALSCDTATNTWKVLVQECSGDGGATPDAAAVVNTPPSADGGATSGPATTCVTDSNFPPPPVGSSGDDPCPDAGSTCGNTPFLWCKANGTAEIVFCENGAWVIKAKKCP